MDPIDYFEQGASTYLNGREYGSKDAVNAALFFYEKKITLSSYLDLGSGPGVSSWPFLLLGLKEIIGVDSSPTMLSIFTEKMKEEAELAGVSEISIKTIQCNFRTENLNITSLFDCIGTFGLLNYLTLNETAKVVNASSSLLKPNGYFCASLLLDESDCSIKEMWGEKWGYKHPRKHFLSLLEENKLHILAENKVTGVFVTQKI